MQLTQVEAQVQQDLRRSPIELVEEGAQAEEQKGGHAETIVSEGEARGQCRQAAFPGNMIAGFVVIGLLHHHRAGRAQPSPEPLSVSLDKLEQSWREPP